MNIQRNKDVITGVEDLEHLHTFRKFPVFMGCSNKPQSEDIVSDMSYWISRGSGLIQLNPLLPLDVLYPEAHGSGCVGAAWAKHHQSLAEFIARFEPDSILEIGGAHGVLATNYQSIKGNIPWTILEPNPTPVKGCKAKIIKGFFDENFRLTEVTSAIVHSHVFEHIYDPVQFIKNVAGFLSCGNLLIFSVPNMRVMLERKFTNCLNFEHTVYLSDIYVDFLLETNGFKIIEKKNFLDDHSIFYAANKTSKSIQKKLPVNIYETNKKLYHDYINFHLKLVENFNSKINKHKTNNIFLFGAHVQSQYLIAFGLNLSRIVGILDNDVKKHGKRLFGTDKMVMSPNYLLNIDSPLVIIRAGTFTNEIVDQIRIINPTATLLY